MDVLVVGGLRSTHFICRVFCQFVEISTPPPPRSLFSIGFCLQHPFNLRR